MSKITVINAYGDNNIGDSMILNVALDIINTVYKKCDINLLVEHKDNYKKFNSSAKNVTSFQHPYGYAIQSKRHRASFIIKILRFLKIYLATFFLIILDLTNASRISTKGFYSYIRAIKEADIVIGMGGGYLITKTPFTDYFGLMMSILPIYVAKIYKKKVVFFPMSFGPFATRTQENIAFNALGNTTVIARDEITFDRLNDLNKYKKLNTFYAPDLGLFFNNHSYDIESKLSSDYIILTAREWLSTQQQARYEEALGSLVDYVWEKYDLKTVFISMARNKIEDNDVLVANRIEKNINNKNIFIIKDVNSLKEVQKIVGLSKVAVCTRLHSAVLAITVKTPFVLIGYTQKTQGLAESYDIKQWYLDINEMNKNNLIKKFDELLNINKYKQFIRVINAQQLLKKKYKSEIALAIS